MYLQGLAGNEREAAHQVSHFDLVTTLWQMDPAVRASKCLDPAGALILAYAHDKRTRVGTDCAMPKDIKMTGGLVLLGMTIGRVVVTEWLEHDQSGIDWRIESLGV